MRGRTTQLPDRWLAVALCVTAVVVVVAALLRIAQSASGTADIGGRLFVVLVAAALLDLAVLSRRRAPGLAWFAVVLGIGLGALDVVAALRASGLVTDGASTPGALVLAVASLVAAAGTAAMDVLRRREDHIAAFDRLAAAVVLLAFAAVATAGIWTVLAGLDASQGATTADGDLAPVRVTGRLALATVVTGLAFGALLDVQGGLRRGWMRWRAAPAGSARPGLVRDLADELLPWRTADRTRAREGERARLAADLNAFVLPDLRRAAAAVESAGAPAPAVAGVRRALEDVEQLMHGRQSIVLEQFGLVAALEWLAERTEEQGPLQIDLQLEGSAVERPDAVAPQVGRAAFRIAMLALDNVQRHADASTAVVRLHVDPGDVRLTITDDGRSVAGWSRRGGRGVADMRAEAASTGGVLNFEDVPAAAVDVRWRQH